MYARLRAFLISTWLNLLIWGETLDSRGALYGYPQEEVQETLSRAHKEICLRILEMSLAQQEMGLCSCLYGFEADLEDVVSNWRELESYRSLLPFGLPQYLQILFCSNCDTLLSIAGVAALEPVKPHNQPGHLANDLAFIWEAEELRCAG